MFALGCFDLIVTLPTGICNMVVSITELGPLFVFYPGWTFNHSDWQPESFPTSMWSTMKRTEFALHWDEWINPFYAVVFFALFGFTPEARKGYCRLFRFLMRPFGVRQAVTTEEGLPDVVFESGRGTNATVTSNASNRYDLSILYVLNPFWKRPLFSTQAGFLA